LFFVFTLLCFSLHHITVTCAADMEQYSVSDFSIGHRGACLQFPEHTLESYEAAIRMGAGVVECDVTFTKDRQLVCRHSQCDLHTTTNVVTIPELNMKCKTPWEAGVAPECCTSDFTLEEIKMLCAKMDSFGNETTMTAEEYAYGGTPDFRTDLYQQGCPQVPTHMESIELLASMNTKFTPELKAPSVEMPYEGNYTQQDYAQQMIDEYMEAGIEPEMVWPQSFNRDDIFYWVANTSYGMQAVALDEQDNATSADVDAWLDALVAGGAKIVAPPMPRLVQPAPESEYLMTPSYYAMAAKDRGLDIITWTLERSGPGLTGYYWSTLENAVNLTDGDNYNLLYVLAMDVGILGIFSDWPATVTFFANCMNLGLRSSSSTNSSGTDNTTATPDDGEDDGDSGDPAMEGTSRAAYQYLMNVASTIPILVLIGLLTFYSY
jgi:glycerophosphoryl diester phosphodiesterase